MKPKRLKKDERGFRTELQRGAAARGFHVVKIPDSGMSQRFGVKKIYDLGLLRDGIYHAIELKEVAAPDWSLPVEALEPHQIENLREAAEKGGYAWIVCRFRLQPGPERGREYGLKAFRCVIAVTLRHYLAAKEIEQRSGLSFEWWKTHGIRLTPFKVDTVSKDGKPRKEPAWSPMDFHRVIAAHNHLTITE